MKDNVKYNANAPITIGFCAERKVGLNAVAFVF